MGICNINNYEGQAAIELESRSDSREKGSYGFKVEKDGPMWLMDVFPMWNEMLGDIKRGLYVEGIAQKFHLTLVNLFVTALCRVRDETGLNRVVLSGGVFHNQIILLQLIHNLQYHDFMVYQHQQVPPGDGGISLGQAIIASEVNS